MRAWQVQKAGEPIDVLHLVELELPQPGPGQVRIGGSSTAKPRNKTGKAHDCSWGAN